MFDRFRQVLYPRIEFEDRSYRARLARLILVAHFIILALWLAAATWMEYIGPTPSYLPLQANLLAVAASYLVGALAWWLLRNNRPLLSGYALAAVPFLLGTVNLFLTPNALQLSTVTMVVSTVIAGAVVGGGAAFVFAGATIGVVIAVWAFGSEAQIGSVLNTPPEVFFVYMLSMPVASISTAVIMDALARQVQRSIDRLHAQAERLATLANTDPLTQLANRRFLLEQLQREFERARRYRRPLSLLYLDLNGFKEVNDRFGHMFGDDVLQGAGRAMSGVLRSTDFLARIGGDEFAVLMPETTADNSDIVTDKLRRALAAYSDRLPPDVPSLTFCAGVAELEEHDETIEAMLSRADSAMYMAKGEAKPRDHTGSGSPLEKDKELG